LRGWRIQDQPFHLPHTVLANRLVTIQTSP
jgi:hypothetical protein